MGSAFFFGFCRLVAFQARRGVSNRRAGAMGAHMKWGRAKPAVAEAGHDHPAACPDCGAEAKGKFCTDCGQEIHVHRTLWHLGHELLHGVMHFDGRFWRTLPLLLVNPGKLTREWCEGRRTRYVSPLAMFLCTLFVMFMALTFAPPPQTEVLSIDQQITLQRAELDVVRKALEEAKVEAVAARSASRPTDGRPPAITSGLTSGQAEATLATIQARVTLHEERLKKLEKDAAEGRADGLAPGSWQAQVADLRMDHNDDPGSFGAAWAKKLKNPELAVYKLQQTTYKFAFLLVPLSIPFMALLFLFKRRYTLYDHSVFVLYSLTFMSLLLMAGVVIGMQWPAGASAVAYGCTIIALVHMFAQLRGAYGVGIWGGLWRTMVLSLFCTVVLIMFVMAILYLGLGR